MKYSIEIKESARKGAVEAFLYYEDKQPNLGDRFLDKMALLLLLLLLLLLNEISKHPKHYPEKYKQFRQALIKPFPYIIIFEMVDYTIVVYKVINAKRNPKKFYKVN